MSKTTPQLDAQTIAGIDRAECDAMADTGGDLVGGLAGVATASKNGFAAVPVALGVNYAVDKALGEACDQLFDAPAQPPATDQPSPSPFLARHDHSEDAAMSQGKRMADAIRERSTGESLIDGFASAMADIREKVVEEPWFGRPVTQEFTAADIDNTPIGQTLESFLGLDRPKGEGGRGIGGMEQETDHDRSYDGGMDGGE
jgi:hypothetical protein